MKILRVLGLGLLIIVLRFLVPELFAAGEQAMITAFDTITSVLNQTQASLGALQ